MASAKARYYANQAKKGKITKAQASSAISGKGIGVSKVKTVSAPKSSGSSALSGIASLNKKYSGKPANSWSAGDVALLRQYQSNPTLNSRALAYQGAQKTNIAQTDQENKRAETRKKERESASKALKQLKGNGVDLGQAISSGGLTMDRPGKLTLGNPNNATIAPRKTGFFGDLMRRGADMFEGVFEGIGKAGGGGRLVMPASPNKDLPDEERQANFDLAFGMPKSYAADMPDTQDTMTPGLRDALIEDSLVDKAPIDYTKLDLAEMPTGGLTYQNKPKTGRGYFPIGENVDGRTAERRRNAMRGKKPVTEKDAQYVSEGEYTPPAQAPEPEVPAWTDPTSGYNPSPSRTVKRSLGSGAFGTGKMVGNSYLAPEEAEYIKELRRSLSGDFGAKAARNQFEELINALNPTYDEQEKAAKEEMEMAKMEDINKLRSMFAQNNTAGSEQQEQYTSRTMGDYAGRLANLLLKLATSKNQDIAQYRSQMQNRLSDIDQAKRSAQQRLLDTIYQVKSGARDRAEKQAAAYASGASRAQSSGAKALEALLKKAAGLPSGGREWAMGQAGRYGLSPEDIAGSTPDNWEGMYNKSFGEQYTHRSTNMKPQYLPDGRVIDGNPYSPTYGQEIEWKD